MMLQIKYKTTYRILVIGGSESGKTNALLNIINHKLYTNKIYLCAKNPYESKKSTVDYKREDSVLKHCNYPKAFMEYSS